MVQLFIFLTFDVQFKLLHKCVCFYYLGIYDNSKPLVLQKPESTAISEADGFMKRLQTLKMKASLACSTSVGKRNKNHLLDQSA